MNLIKSFNFKFLKENMKKSKGAIALLLLVVPIFTLLVTVLVLNNYNVNVPSKMSFMPINFIGLYIIPVIMSFTLFGYVYKKKSVDFINSQPINRKTIFVTNTIGGIILITIIQFITAIILLLCGAFLPNLAIFPQMILDIFIMMWISYVFVFLATNLAMSVSGTFCTQIVLTMLILFLVPFCVDSFKGFENGKNYEMINGEHIQNIYVHTDDYYTMPYQPFNSLFTFKTDDFDYFSAKGMSRMAILGIVYYFIGLYLFKNRKMEHNEESFANEKIHILVKALTIFPMIILLNIADGGKEFNIIALAIIITYYFIYDFLVKRKLKLKTSLIYLVLTLVVLQGICSTNEKLKESLSMPKLNSENIASVKIQSLYYNDYYGEYMNLNNTKLGGHIENKELINLILESAYKVYIENGVKATEKAEVIIEDGIATDTVVATSYANGNETANCRITFKMKNGKILSTSLYIYLEDLEKIMELLSKEEKFMQNIKNAMIKNGVLSVNNYMFLKDEEKKLVEKEIETKVNTMNFKELTEDTYYTRKTYIQKYYYDNHKLQGISIPADITDEVLKIASKYMNIACVEKIKNEIDRTYNYQVYNQGENINGTENETSTYLYYSDDITKFILENENESFDVTKPYLVINMEGWYNLQFYTNKVDEITNIITKAQEYEKSLEYEKNDIFEIIDKEF